MTKALSTSRDTRGPDFSRWHGWFLAGDPRGSDNAYIALVIPLIVMSKPYTSVAQVHDPTGSSCRRA